MKFYRLLPVIFLLFLQSCQNNHQKAGESKDTPPPFTLRNKTAKLNEAATYNTQLGLAYLKQGDRVRAKHKLMLALKQAPNSPLVNASLAYFMEKSGDLDSAKTYYKKAMALAPGAGAEYNNYGTFLCRQGFYKEADGYFLKAIKDIKYEHTAAAYENAGLCALKVPNQEQASFYFNKALEQDPSRAQSLYELVNIELKQEHFNKALSYLQKYPNLSMHEKTFLTMAVDMANRTGNPKLAEEYQKKLQSFSDQTGEKDEYNNHSG